jgi:hypothetical protein
MNPITRQNMLAASAAGGLLTPATAAVAQSGPVPQPQGSPFAEALRKTKVPVVPV